ncbi:thiol peroxidase (atypical 2-Cys peroxiredoxin) [Scopulibacillus darangshiensis]|uniref:Thiol peroxidase n=1 Tax=Scopulibacillus darangshiensis TaxID=442528 RepID=A0A4R2PAF9_9BACL|nr:thiol peroxidase [Scopulibacillus darangshiensis]TCP32059.1 thiol peroxidase (atypical 2-Cys peroxiredoxin) [Scopulibacillus darangshiensis]
MVEVTFKGNPITLLGDEVMAGVKAPNFTALDNSLAEKTLNDYQGIRIISVVPSLDTGVCDAQTRRFNEELATVDNATVITVSVDLPFAQKRWCGSAGLEHAVTLSDHRDLSFGKAYGVVMEELRLLARSVFVIDSADNVVYAEYVKEGTDHPDYEKAIEAAKAAE